MPTLPEQLAEVVDGVGGWSATDECVDYGAHGVILPLPSAASAEVGTVAMMTSVLIPSLARARELAKRAVVQANLRGTALGCQIWAHEHQGEFPPNLDVLVAANYITEKQLTSPRYGGDEVVAVYVAGQTIEADPRNVLVYERPSGDEGVAVAFVDGHAEWTDPEHFRRVLRDTYERLGRLDDLPAAYRE